MAGQKTIMLLFEDGKIRQESLLYGVELAKRMKNNLTLLLLMTDGELLDKNGLEERFRASIDFIRREGIRVSGEIRYGDKTSEFLKFLALGNDPSAIIWGSNAKVITDCGRKPGHWFIKAAKHVRCSIVSPTMKSTLP